MTYAAIRAALQDWFTDANIEGLQAVYKDMPWFMDAAQWNVAPPVPADPDADPPTEAVPARTWAAVGFIHIDQSNESRITVGAPNVALPDDAVGFKQVEYVVSFGLQYQYMVPVVLPDGDYADVWVEGLDSIIDAVKARIREDPLQGATADVIFQAGQNNNDIIVDSDLPVHDPGVRLYQFLRVQFNVTEIINA